uniref:Apple domain-containing protein n=1 Tax=Strongyloides papillosus TaxID=174720 RepID=A0A0N5C2G3_STREA
MTIFLNNYLWEYLTFVTFLSKFLYIESRHGKSLPSLSLTLIILLFTANCLECRGDFCFNFPKNLTIQGADYRQTYKTTQRSCAKACLDDFCCMAYEWIDNDEGVCTHKTRSLNGTVEKKVNAHFGLCLDLEDYDRDKFSDHIIEGTELARINGITLQNCETYCLNFGDSYKIFSWYSNVHRILSEDNGKEDNEKGECFCLDNIESIQLQFGSTSGLLR